MILLIDNYDSFVHNLARFLQRLGQDTCVVRNDHTTASDVRGMNPKAIVLSPGPCTPNDAGCSMEVVRQLGGEIPILGVCLGHQAIAAAFGARIVRAPQPRHGRTSPISHDGTGLFAGIPSPFAACRYHSLVVDAASLPAELRVVAYSDDGVVMALAHSMHPIFGVQFHPEAVLTDYGYPLLANFLHIAGCRVAVDPNALAVNERKTPPPQRFSPPRKPVTF